MIGAAHRPRVRDAAAAVGGALALAIAGVVALPASPASAHSYLVSSTPEEGATLTGQPDAVAVTMSEPLLDVTGEGDGFALQVTGPDGLFYGDGCLDVEGATLSMPVELGEPGGYTVRWRVVSEDGHPVEGDFSFDWAPDAAAAGSGSAEAPTCDASGAGGGSDEEEATDGAPATGDQEGVAPRLDGVWIAVAAVAALAAVLVPVILSSRRRRGPADPGSRTP